MYERYFKIFYNGEFCGRYCGKIPKQAASKMYSKICQRLKFQNQEIPNKIVIEMKECTRGSRGGIFQYECSRIKLNDPLYVTITRGGEQVAIMYRYRNFVRKLKNTNVSVQAKDVPVGLKLRQISNFPENHIVITI